MLFGPKHDILELTTIPRQRAELQGVINLARAERRRQRLMQFATTVLILAACLVLLLGPIGRALTPRPAAAKAGPTMLYLPYVAR